MPRQHISHKSGGGRASLDGAARSAVAGACPTGKLGWLTKAEAKRHARRYGNRSRRFYRCPECGAWHATSMSYREQVRLGLIPADDPK